MLSRLLKFLIIFGSVIFIVKQLGFKNGFFNFSTQRGEGNITEQKRDVGTFTGISLECSGDVEITQGSTSVVIIETYPNIAELYETVVENNTLKLRRKSNSIRWFNFTNDHLKFKITNPNFETISVSGSGNLVSEGKITANTIQLKVSGSGDIKLSALAATHAVIKIAGSGDIETEGTTDDLDITVTGSGDAQLMGLTAKNVKASVTGSGELTCNASDKYDLDITGSGDISYKKTSASFNSHVTGSGNIKAN